MVQGDVTFLPTQRSGDQRGSTGPDPDLHLGSRDARQNPGSRVGFSLLRTGFSWRLGLKSVIQLIEKVWAPRCGDGDFSVG
jgi:hypothetical protein